MRGPFSWDDAAAQYRGRDGRFVSRRDVRDAIDVTIRNQQRTMRTLAENLRAGRLTLAEWQTAMAREIKSAALSHAAAAKGGWAQMTQADYGRVGRYLSQGLGNADGQYEYLRRFVADIESGRVPLDGNFVRRAEMYAQSGRTLYHETERREMRRIGYDQERSVLSGAEHCPGCNTEAGRGWVALGALVPIGQRDCKSNDRCRIVYRAKASGKTSEEPGPVRVRRAS